MSAKESAIYLNNKVNQEIKRVTIEFLGKWENSKSKISVRKAAKPRDSTGSNCEVWKSIHIDVDWSSRALHQTMEEEPDDTRNIQIWNDITKAKLAQHFKNKSYGIASIVVTNPVLSERDLAIRLHFKRQAKEEAEEKKMKERMTARAKDWSVNNRDRNIEIVTAANGSKGYVERMRPMEDIRNLVDIAALGITQVYDSLLMYPWRANTLRLIRLRRDEAMGQIPTTLRSVAGVFYGRNLDYNQVIKVVFTRMINPRSIRRSIAKHPSFEKEKNRMVQWIRRYSYHECTYMSNDYDCVCLATRLFDDLLEWLKHKKQFCFNDVKLALLCRIFDFDTVLKPTRRQIVNKQMTKLPADCAEHVLGFLGGKRA